VTTNNAIVGMNNIRELPKQTVEGCKISRYKHMGEGYQAH
jgi:hypothetical protein